MNYHSITRILSAALAASLFLFAAKPATYAAVPNAINYQGIARKADGAPIGNQLIKIRVSVHQGAANGTIVFQESHSVTTTGGGQFSIKIGQGTALVNSFGSIIWPNFDYFLQTEIDPTGGNTFVDMGTQQFVSVPYAQHAGTAFSTTAVQGTAGKIPLFATPNAIGNSVITQNAGFVGVNTTSPAYQLDVNGTIRATGLIFPAGVSASGDIGASGNLSIGGTASVGGGKGIVRSQNGTQLKLVRSTVGFSVTGLQSNSFIDSGALDYEDFGGVPTVTMGACTVQNGEWYKITITPINVTATQCQFRLFNPASDAVTFANASWQVLVVGPQ